MEEVAASARRASAAIDDALDFVYQSERRIEDMEQRARVREPAIDSGCEPLH